jgi:hypothetical protein
VVGKVLGAEIAAPRQLEQVEGEPLRAVDLTHGDEQLADPGERSELAGAVAQLSTDREALLERREALLVSASRQEVEERPAEEVER